MYQFNRELKKILLLLLHLFEIQSLFIERPLLEMSNKLHESNEKPSNLVNIEYISDFLLMCLFEMQLLFIKTPFIENVNKT